LPHLFYAMKYLYILLLSFIGYSAHAELLDAYIVLPNNDTVKCKLKVTNSLILSTNFFDKLTIVTEDGSEKIYHARDKELLAYGFIEKGRQYHYLYVDVKPKIESGFYQRIVNGKYRLYSHLVGSYGYGTFGSSSYQYVLFNPAGEFVKFEVTPLRPWKKQLRELLKDDENALQKIGDIKNPAGIPKFVLEINLM
jgi:hypothetical protein